MFSLKSMNADDIILFMTAVTLMIADNRSIEELRIISNVLSTLSSMISTAACQKLIVETNRSFNAKKEDDSDKKIDKAKDDKSETKSDKSDNSAKDSVDLKTVNDLLVQLQSELKKLDNKIPNK